MSESETSPEQIIEKRRELVLKVAKELIDHKNYDDFKVAAMAMFASFGIVQSEDDNAIYLDERSLKTSWWAYPKLSADIEINSGLPDYANIYIQQVRMEGFEEPVNLCSAGACSLPNKFLDYGDGPLSFYRLFESQIGIDWETKTSVFLAKEVTWERDPKQAFLFIVSGDKYIRLLADGNVEKIEA